MAAPRCTSVRHLARLCSRGSVYALSATTSCWSETTGRVAGVGYTLVFGRSKVGALLGPSIRPRSVHGAVRYSTAQKARLPVSGRSGLAILERGRSNLFGPQPV
jgi:hypothetical protein